MIRRIELDAFMPHLQHCLHSSRQILFLIIVNGVEFKQDSYVFSGDQAGPQRHRREETYIESCHVF